MAVMATAVRMELNVQRGMLPSERTLVNASSWKPSAGIHVTGVAPADASDFSDVTTAHAKGRSHPTARTTRARSAPMRPAETRRRGVR